MRVWVCGCGGIDSEVGGLAVRLCGRSGLWWGGKGLTHRLACPDTLWLYYELPQQLRRPCSAELQVRPGTDYRCA